MDTDVFIDALKGIKHAAELFKTNEIQLYCSVLTKKELLTKIGLRDSERKKIVRMLSDMKVLKVDKDISTKFAELSHKYGERPDSLADYVIAATAWSKKLPLLTRNGKHFKNIEEITLVPEYKVE